MDALDEMMMKHKHTCNQIAPQLVTVPTEFQLAKPVKIILTLKLFFKIQKQKVDC
jgi:hypothetical protein